MQYLRAMFIFMINIFKSRALLWQMTKRELRQRYLGSYLGILWAFIQPMVTVLIFWFVFQVGFKSMPVDNFPFVLWLVCGMVPWFFIADSIGSAVSSIVDSTFLVKKVVFRVELLPMVKIAAALLVHAFFVGVLLMMFLGYGYALSWHSLQIIYYLFAMCCLVTGVSWLTSALMVFLRDIGQLVAMLLQFAFWGTPIFWSLKTIPEQYHFILKLNPVYYVVEGYRDALIYHVWFWQHSGLTLYFWSVTAGLLFAGALVFRRLRPHFADVL